MEPLLNEKSPLFRTCIIVAWLCILIAFVSGLFLLLRLNVYLPGGPDPWFLISTALYLIIVLVLSIHFVLKTMKLEYEYIKTERAATDNEKAEENSRKRYEREWNQRSDIEKYKLAVEFLKYAQDLDGNKMPDSDLLTDESIKQLNDFVVNHLHIVRAADTKSPQDGKSTNPV